MENRVLNQGSVEMSVVCSDLSLLESINSLLRQKGVIAVEDESGVLHYIVDGRSDRRSGRRCRPILRGERARGFRGEWRRLVGVGDHIR